ncbi:MAG: hypothetical protein IT442_16905 [Phycisphaeraceae bacterium]|nr:hypothetical protein [Phycisphaeraceae bacterium]
MAGDGSAIAGYVRPVMHVVVEPTTLKPATAAQGRGAMIATGHQAWLWHPGILAKDIAAVSMTAGGRAVHWVVDQDVHPALGLDVPVLTADGRLIAEHLELGRQLPDVPTGCCESVPPEDVMQRLDAFAERCRTANRRVLVDLSGVRRAWQASDGGETSLAKQVAGVVQRLRLHADPAMSSLEIRFVSELADETAFVELVRRMREEAEACVRAYNRAVAEHPGAGIGALRVERERVELPLWAVARARPRHRVFAEIVGGGAADLVLEDGRGVAEAGFALAPRALALTATMRGGGLCDLFIHGKGGGVYDHVMEAWWSAWTGQSLAPMAVVSADVHLDLEAEAATPADVRRAVWRAHHLPHNLDRELGLDGEAAGRKAELLTAMDQDRDHRRRSRAFAEIHRINNAWARQHADEIERAQSAVDRARLGVANAATAHRRDWCFGLYPRKMMAELAASVADRVRA